VQASAFGGLARSEHFDCFFNALLAGLGLLRALNPVGVFLFMRVGESGEGFFLGRRFLQGGFEVGGNSDGARGVIEGQFDLDGVPGGRAGLMIKASKPCSSLG